ncbi:hypothetical protein ACVW0J_008369 [Bradyrhizobium sp. i1.7.7]
MLQFRQAKRLRQTERIAAPLQRLISRVFLLPWRAFIAKLASESFNDPKHRTRDPGRNHDEPCCRGAQARADFPCCGIYSPSAGWAGAGAEGGRQHHRRSGAGDYGLRSAQGRGLRHLDLHRRGRDLRYAHHARRQGRGRAKAGSVLDPFRRLQDLDLQAAPGREIPRRHAVQCASLQGELRSAEGPRQQVPLRLLHHQRQGGAGARRIYCRLQSHRSFREFAGDEHHPEPEQRRAFADGVEDQGRRLQSQSRRHRSLHPEIMDGRRSHGSGEEPGLLGQGPSLSRPHHPEAAARRAVAFRLAAIGRGRHHLGRRERR